VRKSVGRLDASSRAPPSAKSLILGPRCYGARPGPPADFQRSFGGRSIDWRLSGVESTVDLTLPPKVEPQAWRFPPAPRSARTALSHECPTVRAGAEHRRGRPRGGAPHGLAAAAQAGLLPALLHPFPAPLDARPFALDPAAAGCGLRQRAGRGPPGRMGAPAAGHPAARRHPLSARRRLLRLLSGDAPGDHRTPRARDRLRRLRPRLPAGAGAPLPCCP